MGGLYSVPKKSTGVGILLMTFFMSEQLKLQARSEKCCKSCAESAPAEPIQRVTSLRPHVGLGISAQALVGLPTPGNSNKNQENRCPKALNRPKTPLQHGLWAQKP